MGDLISFWVSLVGRSPAIPCCSHDTRMTLKQYPCCSKKPPRCISAGGGSVLIAQGAGPVCHSTKNTMLFTISPLK